MTRLALLVAVVAAAACNKDDPPPSCAQVVDHMSQVTKIGLMNMHSGAQRNTRDLDIQFCEQKNFSRQARECLIAAKDIDGIAKCHALVPPPAAAGSGG